jgi:hypothetical protein
LIKFEKNMKGINYITDERGNKTAVVISMKNYKEEIEDFLDGLEAQNRMEEPSVDFEKAVLKIIKSKSSNGKLSAKNKKIG